MAHDTDAVISRPVDAIFVIRDLGCLGHSDSPTQGPEHSSARLERYLQMIDENPYEMPPVDEAKWFSGGHLGGHLQKLNCQVCRQSQYMLPSA